MKILHISTSEGGGGAARSAQRLHAALRFGGEESMLLVQARESGDESVHSPSGVLFKATLRLRPHIDQLPARCYSHRRPGLFSSGFVGGPIESIAARFRPDVVNLHWINGGFVGIGQLASLKTPIVWTLHDSWPFTGGCHLPGDCRRYESGCGRCPLLQSAHHFDLSRVIASRKTHKWRQVPLTVVSPSNWLAAAARVSAVFRSRRIVVIPNGVDTAVFRPIEAHVARAILRLSDERKLILYYASDGCRDPNKGFDLLMEALHAASGELRRLKAVLAVAGTASLPVGVAPPIPVVTFGRVRDDVALVLLNSAADVLVVPSRSENLPNVALEAMACGTPVVAFRVGGLAEIVTHQADGFLAEPLATSRLAEGILWGATLGSEQTIREAARTKVLRLFSLDVQRARYSQLYRGITEATWQ